MRKQISKIIYLAAFLLTVSAAAAAPAQTAYAAVNMITLTDNADRAPEYGGGEVLFLHNYSADSYSQQLSSLIRSAGGKVIVVDGGVRENAGHLVSEIIKAGGHVDTWLITHPHTDHVGALCEILEHPEYDITIGKVYCNLLSEEWYNTYDEAEAGSAWKLKQDLRTLPQGSVVTVGLGFKSALSKDLSFEVLNDPWLSEGEHAGNDAGLVFEITLNGKRLLFLGDIGAEAGNALIGNGVVEKHAGPKLVQLSHHGQDGVSYAFYQLLAPEEAVWCTTEWHFNGSRYDADLTKSWMNILGIDRNYSTKNKDVILK